MPTGYLVYVRERTLFALPFDVANVEVTPGAVPLVEDVARAVTNSVAHYAVSVNGTLVYVQPDMLIGNGTGRNTPRSQLVWVDRSGDDTELEAEPASTMTMALSPDGNWLAHRSDESGENQVFVRPFPEVESVLWQVSRAGGSGRSGVRTETNCFTFLRTGTSLRRVFKQSRHLLSAQNNGYSRRSSFTLVRKMAANS